MILLIASAHAHALAAPHSHDPANTAVLGLWFVAAIAFFVVSRRVIAHRAV